MSVAKSGMSVAAIAICLSITSPRFAPAQVVQKAEIERFALLIGVNDYAQPASIDEQITPLKGPGTDVDLIKQMLMSSFGFTDDGKHILTITGKNATHARIRDAFKSQLIDNAKAHPNAVVMFYFSGHGSQADNVIAGDNTQHDTLLAYDSRAAGGTDIVDIELVNWFEDLRAYTSSITFILDSCHSGSAIKGVTNLVAKVAPPNPRQNTALNYMARSVPPARAKDFIISRREQFALLSGSMPDESSFECDTSDCAISGGPTNYGFFTYYLTGVLKERPNETNEEAARAVENALQKISPYQHPQAVGNLEGRVLGGIGERDDPFISIDRLLSANQFEIHAGASLGVRKGAFLAVYSPTTKHLVGETGRIANARVTEVGSVTSTAELSDAPKVPLALEDKIALVTPFFGTDPLRIKLLSSSPGSDHANSKLTALIGDNKLLRIVRATDAWDVAVEQGCVTGGKLKVAHQMHGTLPQCDSAYYLTKSQGDEPLFEFFVKAGDDSVLSQLVHKIEDFANQQHVRSLLNTSSLLSGQLAIKVIKVDVTNNGAGQPQIVRQGDPLNNGPQKMKVGQNFQLQVLNNAPNRDLYVAIFMLGSSGTTELITVNPHGDLLHAGQSEVTPFPREVGPPLGRETYKAFASTSSTIDYRLLEQPEGSRDSHVKNLNLNDWITADVDLDIIP